MKSETYEIELITPCFCAGANQTEAEIRAPSIRGQLRWWFRALGGSQNEEKQVFGGVHPLDGELREDATRASGVVVRVQDAPRSARKVAMRELGLSQGNYLIWPLRQDASARGVIEPPCRFAVTTSWRADRRLSQSVITRFENAVRAWLLLGSLGTRSRRGWGSIWPADGSTLAAPKDTDELERQLLALFDGHTMRPRVMTLGASVPNGEYKQCLDKMGEWLQGWRAGSKRLYANAKRWGVNDHDAPFGHQVEVFRPALGLPLAQRYTDSSGRTDDRGVFETTLQSGMSDRWASPIHLKVIRLGGRLLPMVVFFPSHAMPDGTPAIVKQKKGRIRRDVVASRELLSEMMKQLPEGGIAII